MTAHDLVSEATVKRSRRAIIAGALGGVGAWALAGIGRASPVHAEGQAVVVGGEYTDATSVTYIKNSSNTDDAIKGESGSSGTGVYGKSSSGRGVYGESASSFGVSGASVDGIGVFAGSQNGTALQASGFSTGVVAQGNSTGVSAASTTGTGLSATSDTGIGANIHSNHSIALAASSPDDEAIHGLSTATSKAAVFAWNRGESTGLAGVSARALDVSMPIRAKSGVFGYSAIDGSSKGVYGESPSGSGVYGISANGYAFRGSGRVKFEKVSGVAVISSGAKTKKITPGINVTSTSFVLLSPRTNLGGRDIWFTIDSTANTFTIHLSSARSSSTPIGWLLVG